MSTQSPSPLENPPPDLLAGEQLPPAPRQARSRAKREALLAAALPLFSEQGYEATTIEAIAQRANVAVGGFYQHFASKRQLLLVLMDQLLREAQTLIRTPPAADADIYTAMAGFVRQGLEIDWGFSGAYRAWREASLRDPALHTLNSAIERWAARELEALLSALLQLPGGRPDLDVEMLASLLSMLFWRIAETPRHDPAEVERMIHSLTLLIVHALFEDGALP